MCWPTAALISCKTIQRSSLPESLHRKILTGAPLLESVTPVYFEARCNGPAHGGDSPRGDRLLYAAPGVGIAPGRLSHDPNPHLLSRSKPGCRGNHGDGPA